ncbi:MAG TPA: hypothetical protein VFT79_04680 [Solirubrobacterales bacterium]|nr:hypothetical protein [Solirubrobacterales bacterium]
MSEDMEARISFASGELGQTIDSARAMVDEQFQIAERLDRKARYQAATSGAFFAVVQAIAINAISNAGLSAGWIATLAALALPAAFLTIGSLVAASSAWKTQMERDLPLADLRDLIDRIQRGDEFALRELAHHYVNLAEERREGNKQRVAKVGKAAAAALMAISLTGLELVLIFVSLAVAHG